MYRELIAESWLRVALFPFNIWLLEIVQGYAMIMIFGKNIAWFYGGWDAWFHGNIKLTYFVPWCFLGLVIEFAYVPILLRLSALAAPYFGELAVFAAFLTYFVGSDLGFAIMQPSGPGATTKTE